MTLQGRMMAFPLTIQHLLARARTLFPETPIVSRRPDKSVVRSNWGTVAERAEQLARGLRSLGIGPGDRVATLCWNHHEHLEAYLGIPSLGAIVHTLNLRLSPQDLTYIVAHAEDKAIIVDQSLLPLFSKFRDALPSGAPVIVVRDLGAPLSDPAFQDYESVLAPAETASAPFAYPSIFAAADENAAAMLCYTSGTTGNPKGVLTSHRAIVLHAFALALRDSFGIASDDVVLPVVPMFHASSWGLPYAAALVGASIAFPGPHLDAVSLLDWMHGEKVTFAGGVPTIWIGILDALDRAKAAGEAKWDLSLLRNMIIGGSAAPPSLIDGFLSRHGLKVTHAWGMTELNPLGTVATVTPAIARQGEAAVASARASQGIPSPFVEMRHVDDAGTVLPWDGVSMGELECRGPWVASSYFRDEGQDRFTADGFFKTGDVVTIDRHGYMRITDRSKDVVKSGGEWISSVSLENALMAHPAVLEAAVFAGREEKWGERPLAVIAFREGQTATDEELTAHLAASFPKYWLPDAYIRVAQVPRGSTGKFLKTKLREDYGDLLLKK
jgi:fatty-acyl-CoA synthase